MPHCRFFLVCCVTLLAAVRSAPVAAQAPSLAALTPADVGLCIEFDNGGQHAVDLSDSEFFHRIGEFPPLARWHDDLLLNLPRLTTHIEQQLGAPAGELRRRLFGGRALVAVWPETNGQPPRPVLLLFQADDSGFLHRALDGICAAQERSGMLVVARQADHAGTTYRVRTVRRGQSHITMYLAQLDRIGVLTSDESVLLAVLDRGTGAVNHTGTLADLPAYREGMARLSDTARVRAFVNPRAWDQEVARQLPAPAAGAAGSDRPLLAVWQGARYWVASFDVVPRPSFETFIALDSAALPERIRRTLDSVRGGTQFASHLPADSLLAVAGRVDLSSLAAGWHPTNDESKPGGMGELLLLADLAGQSLGGLAPDAGGCLLPAARPAAFPFDWAVGAAADGMRPNGVQAPSKEERQAGLQAALTLALPRNADAPPRLRAIEIDGLAAFAWPRLRDRGELFAAFNPGYTALWVASSSSALSRAGVLPSGESLATNPAFVELLSPRIQEPGLVIYVDNAALRRLAVENQASLVDFLTSTKRVDRARAERSVREFLSLTGLADRLLLSASFDETGIACSVTAEYDRAAATPHR